MFRQVTNAIAWPPQKKSEHLTIVGANDGTLKKGLTGTSCTCRHSQYPNVGREQGDRIGRIFANCVIVYFG
jgi:hypothetical protein